MSNVPSLAALRYHNEVCLRLAATLLVLAAPGASAAADPVFDARGFQPTRDLVSELPFEHIDPMTGNVLLTFTDLVLPGNAGFDLRIQRTYNSKIYDIYDSGGKTLEVDSWAGVGWRLHMGRVLNYLSVDPGPIIEMPDGSRHPLYLHMDGNTNHYITKDYWTYEKAFPNPILRLPNGIKYTFGHWQGGPFLYATLIEDPFGNQIVVDYQPPPAQADVISSISQHLVGGQTRTVAFTYNPTLPDPQGDPQAADSLASMAFNGRTWTYTQSLTKVFTYTQLDDVKPPLGPSWRFEYEETDPATNLMLTHVETPNGGEIDYSYTVQLFHIGSLAVLTPALTQRQVSGRDVPPGTWSYAYASSEAENETIVTAPCNIETTYSFLGIGPNANQDPWAIGALDKRSTTDSNDVDFETEDLTWIASVPISNAVDPPLFQTHVALLGQRDVTRSGRTYSTNYTYSTLPYNPGRANNFNDFGRAHTISETGDLARTTLRTFFYGPGGDPSFGTYIVDNILSETVQLGSEAFTRSYTYDPATGFKKSETIYEITTSYTPHSIANNDTGNVGTATDANNHSTIYDYDWAIPKSIRTPEYTITRSIDDDSTIKSETRRGFTTGFLYDLLMRPTTTIPPVGHPIITSYDNVAGTFVRVTRGPSQLTTSLDGFGRSSATSNTQGIKTDLTYDECGRLIFDSYPFTGPNPVGTSYLYDPLGRLLRRTHPNGDFIRYSYLQGVDVDITDEKNRLTRQDWSAFGDPTGDLRLVKLTDANNVATQHTYNALGNLKSVTLPGGSPTRTWTYNTRNELIAETHPENGTTSYTYDPAGNLNTRTDAEFGPTTFSYDDNDRVTKIDRPGSAYDTSIDYDESDNRILLATADVTSLFSYDEANRLVTRTDDVDGVVLNTAYRYDLNDNLERLTYPSGAKVEYAYDSENRITSVTNGANSTYANQFGYHPSGALLNYRAGNNLQHSFTYDTRYRVKSVNAGGPTRLKLTYFYDKVSNVTAIEDARGTQFSHPLLQYDNLDRLKLASGAFGAPSFDYDPKGNRLFKQIGAARTDYMYDPVNQRLTRAEGAEPATFSYDANGNVKGDGSANYSYAPTNMLASAVIGTSTTSYLYDGDALRKTKVGSEGISYYVHGPGGQLLGEYRNSAGSLMVVRDYVLAGTRLIAEVLPDVLTVNPTSLTFLAILDRPPPTPKTLTLTSSGGNLQWAANDNAPWLSISPSSGNNLPATLTVFINHTGLTPGTYSGSITITASGAVNNPVVVPVELTVFETASLYLKPAALSFARPAGGPDPPAKTAQILFPGEPVQWEAEPVESWIEVSPLSGATPGTISVSVEGLGLPPGTHYGSVTVTSNGTPGSPQTLAVELVIGPAPGEGCAADASYCEIFDDEPPGPLSADWIWSEPNVPQVVSDPRGAGQVMLLDPPSGKRLNGDANLATPHAISGTEISVQLMTTGTNPSIPLSLAKIEFYTQPGRAWAKTTRTFGTLRFGSTLRFQYGPTDYEMLVNPMQPGRWYAVRVRYDGGLAKVYVDGKLKFTTAAPDPDLELEAFSLTAWDFAPGNAYVDALQARPGELIVEPLSLDLEAGTHTQCDPGISVQARSVPPAIQTTMPRASTTHTPVAFEPNLGQADPAVKFIARARGHLLLARAHDITLALAERRPMPAQEEVGRRLFGGREGRRAGRPQISLVRMRLGLPDRPFDFQPVDRLPGQSHYLIGDDPQAWHRNVHHYGRLVAKDIYPGIDLVLRDHKGRVEYDLVVAPGADPSQIEVEFEGVSSLRIDKAGDLVMTASTGQELRQQRPWVYQETGGLRRTVAGRYFQRSGRSVGFQLGGYDPTKPLVIDPVLAWTTQFGGSEIDEPHDLAHDPAGAVYITGPAISPDLSTWHVFVSKLAADGSGLIYSTFVGGVGDWGAEGQGIAVDASGKAVVTGPTSAGFPQVPPSSPPYGPGGLDDVFVAKLSADGSQLLVATTLGGSGFDDGHGIALDGAARIYITGVTTSLDFPTQVPVQPTRIGISDAFVAALSSDGQQLLYSTYYGGTELQGEGANKLAVNGSGEAFITGVTDAPDFPGASGCGAGADAFVVRFSPAGGLLGSRCLGGSAEDGAEDITLKAGGGPVIVGATSSTDFPAELELRPYAGGLYDAFIAEFSADLSQLLFSTPFGGSDLDEGGGVITNAAGETYVVGSTSSIDLPVLSPVSCGQEFSANTFVLKLSASRQLIYSTFMPEQAEPVFGFGHAITLAQGGVYVSWTADNDGFVAKLLDGTVPGTVHLAPLTTSECEGDPILMRVERNGGVAGTLIVDYDPRDGTATAPPDYDGTPGSVTLGDTVCAATFSIPTVYDGGGEPDEIFSVELTNVSGPATIGQPSVLGATILGDGRATAQFSVSQRSQPTGPTWQAAVNVLWLTLDAYGGFGPSTVTVTADPTGLARGTHVGRITVTADVTGSPQEILVTLNVSN